VPAAPEQERVTVPLAPVMLVGLRVHIKPVDGDIVVVRLTVLPALPLTMHVAVPVDPAGIVTLVGLQVRLRTAPTVNVTVAVCDRAPLVPVTVTT